MRPLILLPLLPLLLALGGCLKDETVSAYGGAGKIWKLQDIGGQTVAWPATLEFPARGQIAGTAPCNSYTASMNTPYPWFEIRDLVTTKRTCPAQAAETRFLAALGAATLVEVSGNVLILSGNGTAEMVFSAGD